MPRGWNSQFKKQLTHNNVEDVLVIILLSFNSVDPNEQTIIYEFKQHLIFVVSNFNSGALYIFETSSQL